MTKYAPVPLSFICVQPDDAKCNDAPPIVFLHGLSRFKSNWGDVPQEVANATKRKAYVIDARNHGDSEWCDEFTFDSNSDDLLHFMDYIGAKRATLVGHSMGGVTSIKTALRAPERVESIVVEDMSVKRFQQVFCDQLAMYLRLLNRAVKEVPSDVDESTAKNIIGKIFQDNYAKNIEKPLDHLGAYQLKRKSDGRYYHSFNAEGLIKAFEKKAEEMMSENTGEFCGPAVFIYGDKSPLQVDTPVPLSFICVQPDDGKCEDAPPIVFLHGLCRFKSNWGSIPQEVANATQRKVYVIDARNHGDSEWCDEFSFDQNSDDLLHFMDYIGAAKATLVGHSMGGITSIKTALRAPERVENLVVEDMYVKRLPQQLSDDIVKYQNLMGAAADEVQPEVDESTAKNIIGKYVMNLYPEAEKYEKRDHQGDFHLKRKSDGRYYHSCNLDAIIKAMSDNETLMTENTGEFCGPTAFIYGGKSPFQVCEDEENIKRCFPNAEIIKVDEAEHEVHYEFPAEFTEALLGFLNQ